MIPNTVPDTPRTKDVLKLDLYSLYPGTIQIHLSRTHDQPLSAMCRYGVIPKIVPEMPRTQDVLELELTLEEAVIKAVQEGICPPGKQVRVQAPRGGGVRRCTKVCWSWNWPD